MSEHTPLTEAEREVRALTKVIRSTLARVTVREDNPHDTSRLIALAVSDYLAARTSTATADTGLRERVEAWDEGCEAGRLNEKAKWYWAAGNQAAMAADGMPVERPPARPTNPYRAAVDASAAPTTDTGARDE